LQERRGFLSIIGPKNAERRDAKVAEKKASSALLEYERGAIIGEKSAIQDKLQRHLARERKGASAGLSSSLAMGKRSLTKEKGPTFANPGGIWRWGKKGGRKRSKVAARE